MLKIYISKDVLANSLSQGRENTQDWKRELPDPVFLFISFSVIPESDIA